MSRYLFGLHRADNFPRPALFGPVDLLVPLTCLAAEQPRHRGGQTGEGSVCGAVAKGMALVAIGEHLFPRAVHFRAPPPLTHAEHNTRARHAGAPHSPRRSALRHAAATSSMDGPHRRALMGGTADGRACFFTV
eukprot:gene5464-biopygen11739